jgi:hypothetical protein
MKKILLLITLIIVYTAIANAQEAGQVVALKGRATIERERKIAQAVLKEKIYLNDIIQTMEASRAKLLFVDDSLLTLAERTKLFVKEYFYSEEKKRSRTILNLIDGKMRSLVGNADFEVHTPTVVVAARGTYFITWIGEEDGIPVTDVYVISGSVDVRNINPAIVGVVRLEGGMMSRIHRDKPPLPPTRAPDTIVKELIDATEIVTEPKLEEKPIIERPFLEPTIPAEAVSGAERPPFTQPITNQEPPKTNLTPIKIRIPLPEVQ